MQRSINLNEINTEQLANLCGVLDEHIIFIMRALHVVIRARGSVFNIEGGRAREAELILRALAKKSRTQIVENRDVDILIKNTLGAQTKTNIIIKTHKKQIEINKPNQQNYVQAIKDKDCVFGVGPAGTGKTYLAVACAVEALERSHVRRLILVRPAIEAGEKLGFLPGDLVEKVDPYLRPIYDALYEMLGFEKVGKLIDKHIIEIAPLAFMRGRTLNESFIILDEAQNTTIMQMKMFLTRLGFASKMVITGDTTQIDLSNPKQSGLRHAMEILNHEPNISFSYLTDQDVERHQLVKNIIRAYDKLRQKKQD